MVNVRAREIISTSDRCTGGGPVAETASVVAEIVAVAAGAGNVAAETAGGAVAEAVAVGESEAEAEAEAGAGAEAGVSSREVRRPC